MSIQQECNQITDLININKDACSFYETAQEKVTGTELSKIFNDFEKIHRSIANNLTHYLSTKGHQVDPEKTTTGKMAELWANIATKFSSDIDHTLINHLEEAEDRCLHQIEDMMKNDDISSVTKAALVKEASALKQTHDYMKRLKDFAQAA